MIDSNEHAWIDRNDSPHYDHGADTPLTVLTAASNGVYGFSVSSDIRMAPASSAKHSLSPQRDRAFDLAVVDGVRIPQVGEDYIDRTEEWTVEFWISVSSAASQTGAVLTKVHNGDTEYELGLQANVPYVTFDAVNGNTVTLEASLPLNGWTHVAVVADEDRVAMYLNGTSHAVRDLADGEQAVTGFGEVTLGGIGTPGGRGWTGALLDELRIWHRDPLRRTEIARGPSRVCCLWQ